MKNEICESEDCVIVHYELFPILRLLGLFIMYLGNYLFLRDVQYYNPYSHAIFFALPFAILGALLLEITYLYINRCYLGYTTIALVLQILAAYLYYNDTAFGDTFQEENAVYFLIIIAMFIASSCLILSESLHFENRILCVVFASLVIFIVYYFVFIDPYINEFVLHTEAFVFRIHTAQFQSIVNDPLFDGQGLALGIVLFSLIGVALISIPLYLYNKSGLHLFASRSH